VVRNSSPRVIGLTINTPRGYITSMTTATPTRGYTASKEQLLNRVERIHSVPAGGAPDRDLSASPMLAQLSRREREIVTALVSAKPVKQIAATLNISPHTVRNHLKSIFRKLNVGSQVELVAKLTQGPLMVAQASNGN